jgi:hypothetical protein
MALGAWQDLLDFLASFKVSIRVVRCKILIDPSELEDNFSKKKDFIQDPPSKNEMPLCCN